MNKFKVLIIEDDLPVRNLMETTMRAHKYGYLTAACGQEAMQIITSKRPDVILLDLGLPDMDGLDIINNIRSWSDTPIIVISARSEDSDKIAALDAGADDYLCKPFSVEELLARLRVVQRRLAKSQTEASPLFINGELKIDYAAGSVLLSGQELSLTPNEYRLLCLFAKNVGKVLTHTYITQHIWGGSMECDLASLRVFMASLRKKIEQHTQPKYFQTLIGVGYRMNRL